MREEIVAEMEQFEQMAMAAAEAPADLRDEALLLAAARASGALSTLVHLGLISPEEDREWRERLQPVVGDQIRLRRFRITMAGDERKEPSPADQARHAYGVCRDLSLSHLAWTHHTAATEEAITETLAADTRDPERVRRACKLGFGDRGKSVVQAHDL